MIKRIASLLKAVTLKLHSSIRRFPEALIFAVATVITLIALNHGDYITRNNYERLAMVFALGIPVSLCMKVYLERINGSVAKRIIFIGGILGALVFYYFFLLKELNFITSSRYFATTVGLYLLFTIIPYYGKKNHYELYLVNLLTRLFITYLYGVILFLGLVFTVFTVNTLFNLNFSYKIYFDLWLIVVGIFAPAYFLADLPNYEQDREYNDYSKIFKALLLYIVMPIILIYTGILYVYFLKIILERQWPEGLVSHLVLWYSIVSTVVIIFIYPLKNTNNWVDKFILFFPRIVLPILLMMFISMGIRVRAYGVTENRYFVLITGLWVVLSMIHFIVNKLKNVHITIALVIISIISVYGPLSSYSISKLSQNTRFESLLSKYDMIVDGLIAQPATEVSQEDRQNINSIIIYFNSRHELSDLRVIPENYTIQDIEGVLGFKITYYWDTPHELREYFRYFTRGEERVLDISEYNYYIEIPSYREANVELEEKGVTISYNNENKIITIRKRNDLVYTMRLDEVVKAIVKDAGDKYELNSDEMIFKHTVNNISVMYVINSVGGYKDKSTNLIISDYIDFNIFLQID